MCKTVVRSALPFVCLLVFLFFFWHGIPAIVIITARFWQTVVFFLISRQTGQVQFLLLLLLQSNTQMPW